MKTKFHVETSDEVSRVTEIKASDWQEAKKLAYALMDDGDILAECTDAEIIVDGKDTYLDLDNCKRYSVLMGGYWLNKKN